MPASLIAKILGWTGMPQWLLEVIAVGIFSGAVGGWFLYHNHVEVQKGVAEVRAADAKATAKLNADTAVKTAALQKEADNAHHEHDTEITSLAAYRAAHPDSLVRLCSADLGSPVLPSAGSQDSGNVGTGASAAGVQSVQGSDPGVRQGQSGPDISGLLDTLAARADQVSAELREYQAR